jgi:flagellar biosynthesis chaperone FliJ
MTDGTTFREALLQLRQSEEIEARQEYRSLKKALRDVRVRIASIDETIERCSRQAQIAFRNGNDTVGRGNEREVQGLTLLRGKHVSELAGAKARLSRAREEWFDAIQRRKILDAELRVIKAVQETMHAQTA